MRRILAIFYIFSPTRAVIDVIKYFTHSNKWKTKAIRWWIYWWLAYSMFMVSIMDGSTTAKTILPRSVTLTLMLIALSRVHEILYAYISDALDRIGQNKPELSDFLPAHRVHFLGMSYVELVGHFAILAYLAQMLRHARALEAYQRPLRSTWDAVYFSVMTITTTGYGDIVPVYWVSKLFSMYEALSGIVLFVLALGAYLGSKPQP